MINRFVLILTIMFFLGSVANAQVFPSENDSSLRGQTAFDAVVSIRTWLNVEDDLNRFRSNAQRAFELGLRRDGVRVDASAPNYLICRISAAQGGGLVFYQFSVQYWHWSPNDVHRLLWEYGGVATIGSARFQPEVPVSACSNEFLNEWLKHNPK